MRNINCEIYNIIILGFNWWVVKFEKKYVNLKKNFFYFYLYRLKKYLNEYLIKVLNYRIYKIELIFKKYFFEVKKDVV